ncbi:hypothetical protein ACRF1A_000276 [Escherichia coli]
MTPQQENALRSIARLANSEIKKARQQFPDKNVDDICRSVLKKHRETVTLMGFTPTHLSLAIGMLAGLIHLGIRYADVEVMRIAGDAQLSTPCTDSIINSIATGIRIKGE